MGQSNSRSHSSRSTEEKARISQVKKTAVDQRINELNQLEGYFQNSAPISIAKEQVMRTGKPLTKNDYVSIIIALEPSKADKIMELSRLTNEELIFIIRNIVYNPNKILNNYNSLQIENKADILSSHLSSIPTAVAVTSAPHVPTHAVASSPIISEIDEK